MTVFHWVEPGSWSLFPMLQPSEADVHAAAAKIRQYLGDHGIHYFGNTPGRPIAAAVLITRESRVELTKIRGRFEESDMIPLPLHAAGPAELRNLLEEAVNS